MSFSFKVAFNGVVAEVYSGPAIRAARTILRNYLISTPMLPSKERMTFKPHDPSHFPPFQPKYSPSQAFQFTYNAYCSYLNSSYYHEVVQYMHKLLSMNIGVFDLNQLPISLIEITMRDAIDFNPVFSSLMYSPFIYAIVASHIARPDLLGTLANLIGTNEVIEVLSLENCGCVTGCYEFGQAMQGNENLKIGYWDLSKNNLQETYHIVRAFQEYQHPIYYLNMGYTNLSTNDTEILFQTLVDNENFHEIEYLILPGNKINQKGVNNLVNFLNLVQKRNKLIYLDLGVFSSGIQFVLQTLAKLKFPLESLKIVGTTLKHNSLDLNIFLSQTETLQELDISQTCLKPPDIGKILNSISKNEKITSMKLHLAGLKLYKKNFAKFLSYLNKTSLINGCF